MEKHTELANVTCNCSLYMKCNCAKREGNWGNILLSVNSFLKLKALETNTVIRSGKLVSSVVQTCRNWQCNYQQENVQTKALNIPVTLGAAYNFTAPNSWTDRFKVCQCQSCWLENRENTHNRGLQLQRHLKMKPDLLTGFLLVRWPSKPILVMVKKV
jgi:hypothetical protein